MLHEEIRVLHRRGTRRQAEHYVTSAFGDGVRDELNLVLVGIVQPGSGDVVHLHEIDAPSGVHFEEGVIVSLRALLRGVHAVHVRVPRTNGVRMGNRTGGCRAALDRCIGMDRLARNAAHNVDAEFQAEAVHVFSQRREAPAVCGGREAVDRRDQAGILVHLQRHEGAVLG
ncbi:hypothetical protein D3C71_1573140 [compost metagenome]